MSTLPTSSPRSHTGMAKCRVCGRVTPFRSDFTYAVGDWIGTWCTGEGGCLETHAGKDVISIDTPTKES